MQEEDVYELYVHSRMLTKRSLVSLAINIHLDLCPGRVPSSLGKLKCSTASQDNFYMLEVAGI